MANLKNITDLPVLKSAEGLNLIVNDNGAAKQIAAGAVCKVKSVNGAQPDENGNVQIDTASSWNDLKDKPFYAETEVVLEKQVIEGFAENEVLFFAEYPCELNISLGDKLSVWFDGENYECPTINLPDAPEGILGFGNSALMGGPEGPEPFFIIYIGPEKSMQIGALNPGTSHEIGISKEVVHKLDAKYLPNSVWAEEETIVIFDNFDPSNYDNVAITKEHTVKLGDTVTLLVNGVQLMPEIRNNTEDRFMLVEGYLDDNTWAWVQSNYDGTYYVRASGLLTVIITRTTVKTNCDLVFKLDDHEDFTNSHLESGDFSATVEKIKRGFPASIYIYGVTDVIKNGYIPSDRLAEVSSLWVRHRKIDDVEKDLLCFKTNLVDGNYYWCLHPNGDLFINELQD